LKDQSKNFSFTSDDGNTLFPKCNTFEAVLLLPLIRHFFLTPIKLMSLWISDGNVPPPA
jgi:hypothetical protein